MYVISYQVQPALQVSQRAAVMFTTVLYNNGENVTVNVLFVINWVKLNRSKQRQDCGTEEQ